MKPTKDQAIHELVECTLATVLGEYFKEPEKRTMLKSDLLRQVSIVQLGINQIKKTGVEVTLRPDYFDHDSRTYDLLTSGLRVKQWLRQQFDLVSFPAPYTHKPLF